MVKDKKDNALLNEIAEGEIKNSPSAFVVKKKANYKKALLSRKLIVTDKQASAQVLEAQKKVKNRSSKKSRIMSLIFMLVNIIIVAIIIVLNIGDEKAMPLKEVFNIGVNGGFLFLCLFSFALLSLGEGLKLSILSKSICGKRRWVTSFKTGAYGKYYDAITPLSIGGEPYQAYYLNKHGFTAGQSMSITLGRHVVWLMTYFVFCTVILILRCTLPFSYFESYTVGTTVVSAACWIGYGISFCVLAFIVLMAINQQVGSKLASLILKFLHKIKIIKNYEKSFTSVMQVVDDYQKGIKYFAKSPKVFISSIMVSFAWFLINYTIPFFIFCTFNGFDGGYWFFIMSTCVVIDLASSFIPLPGGTGMAELSFSALFTSLFVDGRLFWAMLLWRILTYYGYIFQGLILIIYDYFVGNRKYNWQKKKTALVLESEQFKRRQLDIYEKKVKPKIKY